MHTSKNTFKSLGKTIWSVLYLYDIYNIYTYINDLRYILLKMKFNQNKMNLDYTLYDPDRLWFYFQNPVYEF